MSDYYPPGVSELPGDGEVEKEFIFEVGGEIRVMAYSEEHAEQLFRQNARKYLGDAWSDGDIEEY